MLAPSLVRVTSIAAVGLTTSLVAVSIATTVVALQPHAAPADPCALLFEEASLPARDRAFVARRTLACSDVTHGRISQEAYVAQIAELDAAWTAPAPAPEPPVVQLPEVALTQWATTIRSFSTQYSPDSWAASRVLGPPDVYPSHGDNVNAWASLGADDRDEWLEVGYANPTLVSTVEVYETYNPGAIAEIVMITAEGKHLRAYQGTPRASGQISNILRAPISGCTSEPIVAVRVKLASAQVPGWNELDAIGLVPCVRLFQ